MKTPKALGLRYKIKIPSFEYVMRQQKLDQVKTNNSRITSSHLFTRRQKKADNSAEKALSGPQQT